MGINIRQKGAGAEREIADELNLIINVVRMQLGMQVMAKPQVQRNQNQTAVGGCDLVGTYNYAIEVKRQEALSINTWWKQCCVSAEELGMTPVLLFRQSKQKWRVLLYANVPSSSGQTHHKVRAEISWDDFKAMFREAVTEDFKQRGQSDAGEQALFPS